jgi:hypothetical protein
MVFLRIGRFGQFCRSWLQPLTHPPHRRTGIVGEEVNCPALTGVGLLGVVVVLDEPLAAVRFFSSDQVRNSFCRMNLPLFSLRFIIINSQWLTLRRSSKYSTDQWYLYTSVFCLKHCQPCCPPFHEKDSRHQSMSDQHAYTGKVLVAKLSPQALVEATDSVVCISSTLAIWYPIEEVTIIRPFLPHALHFRRTWLEVSKVLFT